ncbi:MAG TPA: ATP-binding protein [Gammaproteobacteria bacterium]|nr:ATP-binding protein [Gammaproteobacteria bacterium]
MAFQIIENAARRLAISWNEAWFDTLLEKLPAAAYTCDAHGLITSFNERAVDLWGRQPALDDPVDRFCGSFRLFSPDGEPISHDACWMALALKHRREFRGCEILIERPDGSLRYVMAHASPIRNGAGDLLGGINVLVDITDHKRIEQALREQTQELRRLDGELRAKVEQLAIADRRKDEFLAQLAHELRNPLSPMATALETMRVKGQESDEQQLLTRQLGHLKRLTDDLLDLSRVTHGKLQVQRQRLDLAEVVRTAVEASRPTIDARSHRLDVSLPRGPLPVDGDLVRLTQVVTNLLTNAAKFTDPGGTIALRLERHGEEALIRIEDSGLGISRDELPLIFDMFYQSSRIPPDRQGLGVGLALTKRLVEIHGGVIEARSEGPGQGSLFVVRLPRALPRAENPPVAATSTSGLRHRFVVADDNADGADSLAALLEALGHEAKVAYDGAAAVEVAEQHRPEVILLDLGMPGIDGYEVCRRIRTKPWGQDVFITALTGWGRDQDRAKTAQAGFDEHLVKPIDLEKLKAVIRAFETRGRQHVERTVRRRRRRA